MRRKQLKSLPLDGWLADEIRDLAAAEKLTVVAYVRRAVLRQVRSDVERRALRQNEALSREVVEV
jgi:hypothetical protein